MKVGVDRFSRCTALRAEVVCLVVSTGYKSIKSQTWYSGRNCLVGPGSDLTRTLVVTVGVRVEVQKADGVEAIVKDSCTDV
jgi:hypothetical protein